MAYLQSLKERFSKEQWVFIITILSFSLPIYICGPILLIETIYVLYTKMFQNAYKSIPKAKYLFIFCTFSLLISIWNVNWFGIGCTLFMYIACVLLVCYRKVITKSLFTLLLEILIFCSIFWAIYACYEYIKILDLLNYEHFKIVIFSRREYRINSVFFNANYYAMMIEFILMAIGYKIFTTENKKRIPYYLIVALINIAILYLSGTRTAWPAIALGAIVFLILNKNYKWCMAIGIACLGVVVFFLINPNKLPRIDYIGRNYSYRMNTWSAAIEGIKASPFIGKGPMTYNMIFEQYSGHATQHAHSIYLDPILSFGLVGVGIIIPYIVNNCKNLWYVAKEKVDRSLVAFIVGCVVVTLVHGIMDYTVFFTHTGLLFLFITASFSIYKNEA